MKKHLWNDNGIQFPRLLAEIWAVGLTDEQYRLLEDSMDLHRKEIDELFERAESRFEEIKNSHCL